MYRGLTIATAICVCAAVVIPLAVGHTPADWLHLRKAKTRAEIHPVLDRYRQYGLLDDSMYSDVMVIDRGWLDLWSRNLISVEYEGGFEDARNKVLRMEMRRESIVERVAACFPGSDP